MARAPASFPVAVMAVLAGAGVSFAQTTSDPRKDKFSWPAKPHVGR